RLAAYYRADNRRFRGLLASILGFYALFAGGGAAIGYLWGGPLLGLCFGSEFSAYGEILALALATSWFHYASGLVDTGFVASRRIRLLPLLATASGVCTFLLCLSLIPGYGLAAAAICTGLGKLPTVVIGLGI